MNQQRVLVVLDDDPTGTQTVHGVPVLTKWSVPLLAEEMAQSPIFFILTNSRGISEPAAVELALEVGANLSEASKRAEVQLEIVSRGDSTMRGHYPAEVDALAQGLGWHEFDTSIIPYFGPGGRLTEGDVHYVHTVDSADQPVVTPVGETEFARDATFGFKSSNLCEWVEEKTKGAVSSHDVISLSLDLSRNRPAGETRDLVESAPRGSVFVVNATRDSDLEPFCEALDQSRNRNWIHRTAASFVSVRSGMEPKDLLAAEDFAVLSGDDTAENDNVLTCLLGGLVVVGSHTNKTTEQLDAALQLDDVVGIEFDVARISSSRDGEAVAQYVDEVTERIDESIASGHDVVLFTSRERRLADSPDASLALSRSVSAALCTAVAGLHNQPSFLISKGGITSSDIATEALGIERAIVLGQLQPGVPVWEAEDASRFPGLRLVIYPGNVGAADGLATAIQSCRGR